MVKLAHSKGSKSDGANWRCYGKLTGLYCLFKIRSQTWVQQHTNSGGRPVQSSDPNPPWNLHTTGHVLRPLQCPTLLSKNHPTRFPRVLGKVQRRKRRKRGAIHGRLLDRINWYLKRTRRTPRNDTLFLKP